MATFKERLQAVDRSISTSLENDIQALKNKGVEVPVDTTHKNISELINSIQVGGTKGEPFCDKATIYGGLVFAYSVMELNYEVTSISFLKGKTPPSDAMDISLKQDGSVKMWLEDDEHIIVSSNEVIKPLSGYGMFGDLAYLTEIDFSNFSPEATTTLESMFVNCSSLQSLDLNNWDISNVNNLNQVFLGCEALQNLSVNRWDTRNVMRMYGTFNFCTSLETLDLSGWNADYVFDFMEMFSYCSNLKTIYADNWSYSGHSIVSDDMFSVCNNLRGAVAYNRSQTDSDMANYETGYFTKMK